MLLQERPGDHPDANLLFAFIERKLPARDRGIVLTHLARCSDCRDVVALASAADRSQTREHTLASERTVGWWIWRSAGLAAIACLATVVFWAPAWNPKHAPALESKKVLVAKNPKAAELRLSVEPSKSTPPTGQLARQAKARVASAPLPRPAPIRAAPPLTDAWPVSTSDAKEEQRELASPSLDQLAIRNSGDAPFPPVSQAQSFVSGGVIQPRLKSMASSLASKQLAVAPARSIWKLDVPGTLQKSDDGGQIWHTVLVRNGIEFYALSATGAHLWVGGAGGALFHSADDGLHWAQVTVGDGDTRLSEAITRIDLHEDQAVELRTASGSEWVSVDGGSHWHPK